jgi:hypothetical protein
MVRPRGRARLPSGISCTEKPPRESCSLAAVVVEQSAETRPASDRAERRVVVARRCPRPDDLAADPLVVALGQVVPREFAEQVPQVTLAENDEVVQALGSDEQDRPRTQRCEQRTDDDPRCLRGAGSGRERPLPRVGSSQATAISRRSWASLSMARARSRLPHDFESPIDAAARSSVSSSRSCLSTMARSASGRRATAALTRAAICARASKRSGPRSTAPSCAAIASATAAIWEAIASPPFLKGAGPVSPCSLTGVDPCPLSSARSFRYTRRGKHPHRRTPSMIAPRMRRFAQRRNGRPCDALKVRDAWNRPSRPNDRRSSSVTEYALPIWRLICLAFRSTKSSSERNRANTISRSLPSSEFNAMFMAPAHGKAHTDAEAHGAPQQFGDRVGGPPRTGPFSPTPCPWSFSDQPAHAGGLRREGRLGRKPVPLEPV